MTSLPVIQLEPVVLAGEQRRDGSSRVGHNGNIRTVPEGFRLAASLGFRAVFTTAPLVSGVVVPLDHALRAGDVGRQLDLVGEDCFFLAVFGDDVSVEEAEENASDIGCILVARKLSKKMVLDVYVSVRIPKFGNEVGRKQAFGTAVSVEDIARYF